MLDIRTDERARGHAICSLDGRFLSVDDGFCEISARERGEILGTTILDITAEKDRSLNASQLNMLRELGTPFLIKKSYLLRDGSLQPVENYVSLVKDGVSGEILAASVKATPRLQSVVSRQVEVARNLLLEHCRLFRLGSPVLDPSWCLILAGFVLEEEGAAIHVQDVCRLAEIRFEQGLLHLWDLVAIGVFETDGKPLDLTSTGVRLSGASTREVEEFLRKL